MTRCAVFVDAGYLFKAGGQLLATRDTRREELVLDGDLMLSLIGDTVKSVTGCPLLRVYWYDAAANGPTPDHRTIADLPRVKLRLGHLNSAGEQKGVDPLIITDMMMLARNRACDDFLLLSGDADLIIGVLQAQEHGVAVHLLGITPSRGNQSPLLRREADTCQEWNADAVSKFLRMATAEEVTSRRNTPPRGRSRPASQVATPEPAPAATFAPAPSAAGNNAAPSAAGATAAPPSPPDSNPEHRARSLGASGNLTTDVVSSVSAAIPGEHLRTVALAVIEELERADRDAILNAGRPGIIPGDIDRKLLGTAKAMLNTLLQEPEKRLLRRYLFEACKDRASGSSA